MVVAALCHLCPRPAIGTCVQCGRPACLLHLDAEHRVCQSCRQGVRAPPARRA